MTKREARQRAAFAAWVELDIRGVLLMSDHAVRDEDTEADMEKIREAVRELNEFLFLRSGPFGPAWDDHNAKVLKHARESDE